MRPPLMLLALVAHLPFVATARAQEWPSRPMTMVVPFAAGGGSDLLGRILAPPLSELLGQPVTVENVGGGGGVTPALPVSRAAPHRFPFVVRTTGTHAPNQNPHNNPPYQAPAPFPPEA